MRWPDHTLLWQDTVHSRQASDTTEAALHARVLQAGHREAVRSLLRISSLSL